MCCCSILSVGGDGMFAEIVHGLLTNVLKASGSDQPSVDAILPQPKWRIGIIPAGMLIFSVSFIARSALKCTSLKIWHCTGLHANISLLLSVISFSSSCG